MAPHSIGSLVVYRSGTSRERSWAYVHLLYWRGSVYQRACVDSLVAARHREASAVCAWRVDVELGYEHLGQ